MVSSVSSIPVKLNCRTRDDVILMVKLSDAESSLYVISNFLVPSFRDPRRGIDSRTPSICPRHRQP